MRAPIAQRTEHRSSDLLADVQTRDFAFKLELLCYLPETCFEYKIITSYMPFHSVY